MDNSLQNKQITMEQKTKIDAAIQEVKFKLEVAEREYESVINKMHTLRDILDTLDKIQRNENLK
jgi:hypothetical protein